MGNWRLRVLSLFLPFLFFGCVVTDHDTNKPSTYESVEQFNPLFEKLSKGQSWHEVEGILRIQFENSENVEVKTGLDAIKRLFENQVDIFRGVFATPERLETFFAKAKSYRLVIIPWRDVVRRHDRIYFNRQEFSENGIDNQYLILFKQEGEKFVVEHLQPGRKVIDKAREREAFALILTDLLGLPTITPDLPDVDIPGLKVRP